MNDWDYCMGSRGKRYVLTTSPNDPPTWITRCGPWTHLAQDSLSLVSVML